MGCALGNSACRHLIKTCYERLSTMFKKLEDAEKEGVYREHSGSTVVCTLFRPYELQQRIGEKIQANSICSCLAPSAHMVKIEGTIPMCEHMLKRRQK